MRKLELSILAWLIIAPLNAAGDESSFQRDVLPILSNKCFQCHGPDEEAREAELRLDGSEFATADRGGWSAIVPGSRDSSLVWGRINDHDEPMPPADSNSSLTPKEIEILGEWIDSGAEYVQHWAFTPPIRSPIPTEEYGLNPIDAFIGYRLQLEGLTFSPEASPERLIRRITLDLTGVPPTIEEVEGFVRDYEVDKEQAWESLIDRLLQSPRYGETMALPWLDAARFADTDGYQYDGPRHQWPWRDWVINAYNENMPFDQFTVEQLAGDLIENATRDQHIATGFNRNHRYNSEAGLVVEEYLLENAVDRVDTTSTLWMGLTVGCARCHDHKYDPVSQREYYQLIAFFNNVPEAGRAIKSGNSEPYILAPTNEQREEWLSKQQRVVVAFDQLAPTDEPYVEGPLIDRQLVHRFPLNELPSENAAIVGAPSFESDALVLDGDSSVKLTGLGGKLPLRANTPFSIAFWVRVDDSSDSIVLSRQNPGTGRPGIELAVVDGKLQFDLITRWVAGNGRVRTVSDLPIGEWMHVVVTNDASQSANGQLIYIDGTRAETAVSHNTNSNVGGVNENRPLILGHGIRPGGANFQGAFRDLRLYTTALWPEEIEVLSAVDGSPERQRFARIKMTAAYADYVAAREELDRFEKTLPTVMVMEESPEPRATYVRIRGRYDQLGDEVARDVPSILPTMNDLYPRDRLGFAMWLMSGDHPLTARVAVNRYWQKFFGTGLVGTTEDFGVQGEMPSHPELLDWLAVEFADSEWNVHDMIRLIVTSRTYRQSSHVSPELLAMDPDNRLLARGPRFRLSGHALRDQALFVSGLLIDKTGGPSVSPYQPANLWAEMSMGMRYKQSSGDDLYRRSLYTIWKRTIAPPALAVFDAADREACWVKRHQTNTPLQALTLLNETGYIECPRNLAQRMLTEGKSNPIEFGFRSVTSRRPTDQETELMISALNEFHAAYASFPDDARQLIQVGESVASPEIDPIELAAYTALANLLLNLDETISRE